MNFTFTWILDQFGLQMKPKMSDVPFPVKKAAKKSVKIPKATTRKPKTK